MAVKKITKRWLFNSLGVILVILIALEVVIAFSVKDYYYGSVERVIYSQAETVSGLLSKNYSEEKKVTFNQQIDTCPCGSGKPFAECHGQRKTQKRR